MSAFLVEGLFNRGAFWLLAVLVLLDTVVAGNVVAWTAKFFEDRHGGGPDQAGPVLAASAAGVFVGRMVMGTFVSGRVGDRPLLGICYAAGILMYGLILVIPGYRIGLVLVFLNGAFIAAQAPTMYRHRLGQVRPSGRHGDSIDRRHRGLRRIRHPRRSSATRPIASGSTRYSGSLRRWVSYWW